MRGERGGYARALKYIRRDEGLSRRKAKRWFLRRVWELTSPGLQALKQARLGLPYGPVLERTPRLRARFEKMRDARPLSRNERRLMRRLGSELDTAKLAETGEL